VTAERCAACGARLFGVSWCSQCGTDDSRKPVLPVGVAVTPQVRRQETRWAATSTTFGPAVKIIITAVVALGALLAFLVVRSMGFDPTMLGGAVLLLGAAVVMLRSLWRRAPVASVRQDARHDQDPRRP
jgi:hypothetical protein